MKETYCEWCGSILLEDGHCPITDCVQNVLIDALHDAEQEEGKKDESNQTA